MNSSFFLASKNLYLSISIIIFIICVLFIPAITSTYSNYTFVSDNYNMQNKSNTSIGGIKDSATNRKIINMNQNSFLWPIPGYTRISSKFGNRSAPTKGASSSHSGIDIPAPAGTNIVSVISGQVIFTGFKGAGGYTITIKNNNYTISYCHVSPNFLFHSNDFIKQGEVISHVGPLNVYGVPNNPYKDKGGNPTNGASTGPHLHLTIKKDGIAVNPLDYF